MNPTTVKGLTHVGVRVTNLERAVAFYRDVLGLEEQFRLTGETGDCFLAYMRIAEDQFIELFPGGQGAYHDSGGAGPVHVCLQVEDIQAAYREVTARGGRPLHGEPRIEADDAWQFWIADPDGNLIEFHQFTPRSLQRR